MDWTEVQLVRKQIQINANDTISLIGQTVSGIRSCITIPELGVVFDIGFCPSVASQQKIVLVTHGHADHIGSLHLHSFERQLQKMVRPKYLMPIECHDTFHNAYDNFRQLNYHEHSIAKEPYKIIPVSEENQGKIILYLPPTKFNGSWTIRAYRTTHVVPSTAYVIYQMKRRLKQEYKGLDGKEIATLVKSGINVNEVAETAIIGYTGDTTIEGVLQHPELLNVKILIIECTYVMETDEKHEQTVEEAKKRGHIHERDFHKYAEHFRNEQIILCHFSTRYKKSDILASVERLQSVLKCKVDAFI